MKVKELSDWSNLREPALQSAILKNAKLSQLGHFVILEVECQGALDFKMLHVETGKIDKVLSLLKAHIEQPLHEIAELEVEQ